MNYSPKQLSIMLTLALVIGSACVVYKHGHVYAETLRTRWQKDLLTVAVADPLVIPKHISIDRLAGKENIIPIAIIGSGVAGLNAAVYGARSNMLTLVIEGEDPGGLITKTTTVENWPGSVSILGKDIVTNVRTQAEHSGAQFMQSTLASVDFTQWPYVLRTQDGITLHALTVIIATGATPRRLGIPGEEQYFGRGVSTCALCDAPFFKDEDVVVVGGGDSAIEETMQLAPFARSVTILVRKDHMRANPRMQERLAGYTNVTVLYNKEVVRISGDDAKVTSITVRDTTTGIIESKLINGVFLAIGHEPNTQLFKGSLAVDAHGYIVVKGRSQATSVPGVYAAGDVEDREYRQAGVASSSGIKAGIEAGKFLAMIGFTKQAAQAVQSHLFVLNKEQETVSLPKQTLTMQVTSAQ